MADIVISEFMDEDALAQSFRGLDVLYQADLVDQPQALLAALENARALIVRNRTQVTQALIDAAKNLQVVGRLGVGLDNIDLKACRDRNIAVVPATGANDLSVAEYVITAALVLLRRAWFATDLMVAGEWPRNQMMGRELAGKTLGLIGYGAIARETAKRAHHLGMRVVAYDPFIAASDPAWGAVTKLDLPTLAQGSDVISLHIPLTEQSHHLVDAGLISEMSEETVLINASRGGVVDEPALIDALRHRRLAGAALDVFEREPLAGGDAEAFADIPNLILTPHIAGVTQESNVRVSAVTIQNVLAHLR